jgi:hypothetical protein
MAVLHALSRDRLGRLEKPRPYEVGGHDFESPAGIRDTVRRRTGIPLADEKRESRPQGSCPSSRASAPVSVSRRAFAALADSAMSRWTLLENASSELCRFRSIVDAGSGTFVDAEFAAANPEDADSDTALRSRANDSSCVRSPPRRFPPLQRDPQWLVWALDPWRSPSRPPSSSRPWPLAAVAKATMPARAGQRIRRPRKKGASSGSLEMTTAAAAPALACSHPRQVRARAGHCPASHGLSCYVSTCANGKHTTLTGHVYDPAGKNRLYKQRRRLRSQRFVGPPR